MVLSLSRLEAGKRGAGSIELSMWVRMRKRGNPCFGVAEPISALNSVLQAPQPLDAWSRARWMPMAQKLGADTIGHAVLEQQLSPQERVRAIEVFTEMFNGLSTQEARIAAHDTVPAIRARVAWSLGRSPCAGFIPILLPLALDQHPLVRRCALEAIADRGTQLNPTNLLQILPVNLAHPEGRVRQAAARLAARLPEPVWNKLWTSLGKAAAEARLTTALAGVWRNPNFELQTNTLDTALSVLKPGSDPALRLQAVRLIMLALGDWNIHNPSVEVYSGYELAASLKDREGMVTRIQTAVRPVFGANNSWLDAEAARLLGMLEDKDTNLVERVVARFTPSSYATADFHYLVILSRLPGVRTSDLAPKVAHAILNLDSKLKGQEGRNMQNWSFRLAEIVKNLIKRDPDLEPAILKHPDFPKPAHLNLVEVLDPKYREAAARRYLVAVQNTPRFPWSGPLIELLSFLPPDEVRSLSASNGITLVCGTNYS